MEPHLTVKFISFFKFREDFVEGGLITENIHPPGNYLYLQLAAMEEAFFYVARGCKLARELEQNLPNLANHPRMVSECCDEIMNVFGSAKEKLINALQDHQTPPHPHMFMDTGGEDQEFSSTTYLRMLQGQYGFPESKLGGTKSVTMSGRDRESSARSTGSGGEVQAMDGSDSGGNGNSQRSRSRKDHSARRTETVPAPSIGNTEIPPDDNFTWRKYGQKEILGSKYPRSYYRCTHQKLYNCPAKRQVQRLDHDPSVFEITYLYDHTCHKSATAPSTAPPPSAEMSHEIMIQATSAQLPMGRWLSIDLKPTGENPSAFVDNSQVHMHMDLGLGVASSSSIVGTGGSSLGPSSAHQFGREVEYPVADLADTMFNAGSSSSNSMDFLFTHAEWESAGDKKN